LNLLALRSAAQLQACVSHITLFAPKSYGNLGNVCGLSPINAAGDLFND
jgi:hypothetical protein